MEHVIDANIFMDFDSAGLTFEFLKLPYLFVTSDIVIFELEDHPPGTLVESHGGVLIRDVPGKHQRRVVELRSQYPKNSIGDLSSLVLAELRNGVLVTGDGNLRKAAEEQGITVRGSLWLLDRMVEENLLDPIAAARALDQMLERGRRLPANECVIRIQRWREISKGEYK